MKKLSLLLGFIALIGELVSGQNSSHIIRCTTSDHYFKMISASPDPKRVNKPCSICYNNGYFSFYIPELGTRSFRIAKPVSRSVQNGVLREDFDNEEDYGMMRGDISVDIEYEHPTTTFVISFTKFGTAYIIQTNRFLGDAEIGKSQYAANLKATLNKQRTDSTPKSSSEEKVTKKIIVAHKLNIAPDRYDSITASGDTVKYRYVQTTGYDMQDYFNKSFTDTNATRLLHYPYQNGGIWLRPVLNKGGTITGIIDDDENGCSYGLCNIERMDRAFYDRILAEIIQIFRNCQYKWVLPNESGNVVYIGANLHIDFPMYR